MPARIRMLLALLALAIAPAGAAHAAVEFEDSYSLFPIGGGPLISSGPTITRGVPGVGRTRAVNGSGPLDTNTAVILSARASQSQRTLGASALAQTQVLPYDPEEPPQQSVTYDARGTIEARLDDRVRISTPSRAANEFVDFEVLSGLLEGEMQVPDVLVGGGIAQVQVGFAYEPADNPGGGKSFVYEVPLLSGDAENPLRFLLQSILLPDETRPAGQAPVVRVQNGRTYRFRAWLRVSAEALPEPFPAESPPLMQSRSSFETTFRWGGLGDFADEAGEPLADVVLESEDGIDWVLPAPEPGATASGAAALLALAACARRRPRARENPLRG